MGASYDFTIEQYATFTRNFTVTDKNTLSPIDFTGATALLQIRDDVGTLIAELTTSNGGITLGNGTIDLHISAAVTATLSFQKAVHDLIITHGTPAVTERFFQGKAKLSTGVSHA